MQARDTLRSVLEAPYLGDLIRLGGVLGAKNLSSEAENDIIYIYRKALVLASELIRPKVFFGVFMSYLRAKKGMGQVVLETA